MKIAYFDCFAGASGDMILGALLDAGLDIETLRSEVAKLGLSGYELGVKKIAKKGIAGSQALVILHDKAPHGHGRCHNHEHGHSHPHAHGHDHHQENDHENLHDHDHVHHHHHDHGQMPGQDEHDHSHKHEHSHPHVHRHDHSHEHDHSHFHSHEHDHSHEQEHGHPHTHEHGHHHDHEHENLHDRDHVHHHHHDHGQMHGHDEHDHSHKHEHSHPHVHRHDHSHDHDHSHSHPHEHEHSHEQEHDHPHTHEHDHSHDHGHSHSHDHAHCHDHEHAGDCGHSHSHEHPHPHPHSHGHGGPTDSHGDNHHHRNLGHIRKIIEDSTLSDSVKEKSIRVFTRLAEAEAKVHGTTIGEVHFHEVGAMDSIIDIVGGVAGLEAMGIERIHCSALHVGSGTVNCAHGTLPVPAPATLELIKGKPIYSTGVVGELLTPTGAAILTTLAETFGPMPAMTVEKTGYGSGEKDPAIANLLRISIGESQEDIAPFATERVAVIETNIDDMNPQIYDYLMEKLLDMGVLDILLVPVQMKKNRPGTMVKIICPPDLVPKTADLLIRETTSIGLRWRIEQRFIAKRRIETVETPYGPVGCKVATSESGEILNIFPEYEDCKQAAIAKKVPIREVMEKTLAAASNIEK